MAKKIQPVAVRALLPTQLTVGMLEVKQKVRHLKSLKGKALQDILADHPMPVVIGPGGGRYITDHHHLARAALEAGIGNVFFLPQADLSKYRVTQFWKEMNRNHWVHPLDANGVRHHYTLLPKNIRSLVDDVYRSLAAFVRNGGGYDKTPLPFAEFVWADFFRRNVAIEDVRANFKSAVKTAIHLAHSKMAQRLPGYRRS